MLAPVLRSVAVPALLCSPVLAAQLTVGPAGSGAAFTEIADAVAAAQPGDVVLVAPGNYAAFTIDKSMSVVGAGPDDVIVAQGVGVAGLRVLGLAADESAFVSGLTVSAGFGVATPFPHVEIAGNAGRVSLVEVEAGTLVSFNNSGATLQSTALVTDSAAVLLDGCDLRGFRAPPSQDHLIGESGLEVSGSTVWISDSVVHGAGGGSQFDNGAPGAPAIVATDSTLVVANSRVQGGYGGVFWGEGDPLLAYGWSGEPGIWLQSSTLDLAGGDPDNATRGGFGPLIDDFNWYGGGPGVRVDGASSARIASDALVEYGESGDGSVIPGGVAVQTGGSLESLAYRLPTADWKPTSVAPGAPVAIGISGASNAPQLAFVAPGLGAPTPLPGFAELAALPLAQAQFVGVAVTGPLGWGALPLAVPADPALSGASVVAQTVEAGPNGLLLSNPTALAIR